MKKLLIAVFMLAGYVSVGQQLTYEPINPAFGGDTFNYQWLLSSANAQNSFEDPDANDGNNQGSELDQFAESLNRQVLSSLSRTLFSSQLGDGLEEGTFTFGNLTLEIYDSAEGLVVNILDVTTGDETQIIVPN
ncbi:curli production assembly/transport component CsgF [Mesoflavibacter sp. CH_XMU1404-2]|uniref:curli production assembly/transport component CsgF n=1 Tax=Mesoflavibacter sp. CH_XMU1404-2 TaxID=3107766 RepID=UPI00243DE104